MFLENTLLRNGFIRIHEKMIGINVIGMLSATMLAVFLVPVLYVAVDKLFGARRKRAAPATPPATPPAPGNSGSHA